ncbi:MAG: phage terminase large subunit [Magnetospiraceae bacterium]
MNASVLDAVLRTDFLAFVNKVFITLNGSQKLHLNWHLELMAEELTAAGRGETKRLIVNIPPRNLKSISASVALPAWILGHDPTARIVCVSYSQDLANKHARDCRAVMETAWYQRAFRNTRIKRTKRAEADFDTTQGGGRLSTSVGGTLTGQGGNIIIIDDPIRATDAMSRTARRNCADWYDNTLYSRLDSKQDGVIILIQQRFHVDDRVSHVYTKETWKHLVLPAIAEQDETWKLPNGKVIHRAAGEPLNPAFEPLPILETLKSTVGSAVFAAQYQQCPVPPDGTMIKRAWIQRYDTLPPRSSGTLIVQSWDTASKGTELSDYSVCTTWQITDGIYYLVDVYRARLEYPELKRQAVTMRNLHRPTSILIEDKGSGISLAQELWTKEIRSIRINPRDDKETRLYVVSHLFESGQVQFPKQAPWMGELEAELFAFPHGRHDDQVDSITQFLAWKEKRKRKRIYIAGM